MDPLADAMPGPPPGLGPEIRPGAWDETAVARAADALPPAPTPLAGELIRACLLLWHDRLDAAHRVVQRHEGERTADCLHAIMHRREPDEGNSRYWWARVGRHPLAAELGAEALRLGLPGLVAADGGLLAPAMASACCRRSLPAEALGALQARELQLIAARILAP